jgi:hypothetical protein
MLPNPLLDFRAWTREQGALTAVFGDRTYWQFPKEVVFPAARVYQVDYAIQPGESPIVDAVLAWDLWGGSGEDFTAVSTAATVIVELLHQIAPHTIVGSSRVLDADVTNAIPTPDPEEGLPRFLVNARITCVYAA